MEGNEGKNYKDGKKRGGRETDHENTGIERKEGRERP